MRWPWKNTEESETELLTTREGESVWQDPADPVDGANDNEDGYEPEPDPLDDLEPEIRAQVDQRISQAAQDALQRARAGLRRAGYDLTDDLNLAIVDPEAASRFAPSPRYQEQPPPPNTQHPTPNTDDDEEIPDPITQPKEFRRWNKAQQDAGLKSIVQEALAPVMQGLHAVTQRTLARDMDAVMQRVPDAVMRYAPMLENVLQHPRFEAAYRQVLSQVDPSMWDDPANLARMAGGLLTDLQILDQQEGRQPPKGPQARPGGPRAVGQQQNPQAGFNARLSQMAAANAGPSVGTGRGTQKPQVNEYHQQLADRLSQRGGVKVTAEEVLALDQDPTGDLAQQFRDKRLFEQPAPKNGRGRR